MGRNKKEGLDYFPFEVDFFTDIKVRKLIKYQGGKAVTVYALLLCFIYKSGYYLRWDQELPFIVSEQTGFEEVYILEVIKSCLTLGLFSKELYESNQILTSKGIQDRYVYICNISKTPIACAVSSASGFEVALCVGSVIGGAMFGDNLSFISDTTIAACNGQGCAMKDKFKENFFIALPAALISLILILVISLRTNISGTIDMPYSLVQIIPYVLVLIGGVIGINVFVVLLIGIVSGVVILLLTGAVPATEILKNMGTGVSGMFETAMVAILVSAICALIRENGGFEALLNGIRRLFKGKKNGQLGMGLLVGLMDISTANNTVAIVMANPIAKEMSETYGITPRKSASILDTFSCIFQGIIPYGAQMLVAITATVEMGHVITAFDIIPFLFYPFALLLSSLAFIYIIPERKAK